MKLLKKQGYMTILLLVASLIGMSITWPQKNNEISETPVAKMTVPAKNFSSLVIDDNNIKWFLTENGLVSFDGTTWTLHSETAKIGPSNIKNFTFETCAEGTKIWIASPEGAIAEYIPGQSGKEPVVYLPENSSLTSKNVMGVAVGKNALRWFATDKGISGLKSDKWLTPDYEALYPEAMFNDFPITSVVTSPDGDSLYVGTLGAGVTRVFRSETDAISGASSYAYWGPIIIPSDNVYCIYLSEDGITQWFGTDGGVGKHVGGNTLDHWDAYTTAEGLVDDFVQAITSDKDGKMWFGTKGGISVFDDDSTWITYKTEDGLASNNILCLGTDKDGVIWIGTDNGVNSYKDGEFKSY
ncbi:MAG: ligand-binding sensor domain-containing protein [Bacteroidales bacterium]